MLSAAQSVIAEPASQRSAIAPTVPASAAISASSRTRISRSRISNLPAQIVVVTIDDSKPKSKCQGKLPAFRGVKGW